jgi:hypothetical protein
MTIEEDLPSFIREFCKKKYTISAGVMVLIHNTCLNKKRVKDAIDLHITDKDDKKHLLRELGI